VIDEVSIIVLGDDLIVGFDAGCRVAGAPGRARTAPGGVVQEITANLAAPAAVGVLVCFDLAIGTPRARLAALWC
jgi:hypothetical protein